MNGSAINVLGRSDEYSMLPTAQQGTRTDRAANTSQDLGVRCNSSRVAAGGGGAAGGEEAEVIVITVTQADFSSLPVEAPVAHAGPPDGWLPVHMDNVLYAESAPQTLDTSIIGVPVQIRATPTSYSWDLGDGNVVTTSDPGRPYPHKDVVASYAYEGWYDITLTTTHTGQFSVAGGPWQDIDGTITVESDPVEIFSKSLESRLVNGDVPVDEDADPWIPARSEDTEGPQDPHASGGS